MESTVRKISYTCLCLASLSLACGALFADDDADASLQDLGSEEMVDVAFSEQYPFRVSAHGDWIGRSKIDKKNYHNQHVNFYFAEVLAEGVIYYDPDCREGLDGGIGYSTTHFRWNKLHHFNKDNIDMLSVTLSAFSERLTGWLWQTYVTANWETKFSNIADYTNYDILLWGRYEFKKCFHMHIGFLAQTGMKIDHILPIIGFDYTYSDKWKINAVFPMNLSIVYTIDKCWSASLAGRLFEVRYRLGNQEKLSKPFHHYRKKALFQYRNEGAELALSYSKDRITANIHGGVTFGGQFRLSDHNNKNKHHFKIDSAGYAGGELAFKF